MYRFIFFILFIFFSSNLIALDVTEQKIPVYKEIEIAHDINNINEAIIHSNKFKLIKYYRYKLHQKKSNDGIWLKIPLINTKDKTIKRSFITKWNRVKINAYLVDDKGNILKKEVLKDDYLKHTSALVLPAKTTNTLYLQINTNKALDQFNYIYIIDSDLVDQFIILKEKLFHHGFFFGVLLSMAMYSFFMYFSIKEKGYLYLGIYQAWVIIATTDIWQYFFILLEDFPDLSYLLLKSLLTYSMTFFSIIFTKVFLNTKNTMPAFNMFLNVLIVVLIPLHIYPSAINYGSFLYVSYVIAGLYSFKQGNKAAFFYTLGFFGFALYSTLISLSRLYGWNFYFELLYARQIFTSIESFALTMALYLQIKSIIKEKEKAQAETIKQEKMLLEQSRFASMGEMLASIAHQWRQPLNHLNMINNNLRLANRHKKLDTKYLESKIDESDKQLQYMSSTIEDFSNFFSHHGVREKFSLNDVCEYAIELVDSRLKKHKISTSLKCPEICLLVNCKNEVVQILTIILNNAIDALMFNNIEDRKIDIFINCSKITISDNAGGIPEDILHKIFDPYFSTKHKKFGTGLGLYTATIVMRDIIKGKLSAKNGTNGAIFTLSFPNSIS